MYTKPEPEFKNSVKGLYFESLELYNKAEQELYAGRLEAAASCGYQTVLSAVRTLNAFSRFLTKGSSEIAFHLRYSDIISVRFEKTAARLLCAASAWRDTGELGYAPPLERRNIVELLISVSEFLGYIKSYLIDKRII